VRVLVVANPRATSITANQRRVLVEALGRTAQVLVEETANRGHGAALACRAMRDGVEAVVALGGDGTINEVVNGVLTDGVHDGVPAVGVVPAGSTNVFARALGLPNDPIESTAILLDALVSGRRRRISLGRADDRWFVFAAGFGYDAAVVAAVERARAKGHRSTPVLYLRTATREWGGQLRQRPAIAVEHPDGSVHTGLHFAVVSNVSPWTYLGNRAVTVNPQASFDTGLSLYGRLRIGPFSMVRGVADLLATDRVPGGRAVLVEDDLAELTLTATRPQPFEVDGDYLGVREHIEFRNVPRALAIIA
jgi:diacylglycerol kinase family enzyme